MEKKENSSTVLKTVMKVMIILLSVIAALLFSVYIWAKFFRKPAANRMEESVIRNYVVTDVSFDRSSLDGKASDSTEDYDVKMNTEWDFAEGKLPSGNAYVENPVSNVNDVYFDITLSNGKVIYTSPVLPVGSHIENIAFENDLPAGKYNAVLTYYLLDRKDDKTTGELKMALTLTVRS